MYILPSSAHSEKLKQGILQGEFLRFITNLDSILQGEFLRFITSAGSTGVSLFAQ